MGFINVSSITLNVNGVEITDFKSVTENSVELYKPVKLMNKTGHRRVTPRYGGKIEYFVPDTEEFDWTTVKDARLTITYESGKKITFTGVYVTDTGDRKVENENETVQEILWSAENRVIE